MPARYGYDDSCLVVDQARTSGGYDIGESGGLANIEQRKSGEAWAGHVRKISYAECGDLPR